MNNTEFLLSNNRRDFLKAASLAASTLLPQLLFKPETNPQNSPDYSVSMPEPKTQLNIQRFLLVGDIHVNQTNNSPRQANTQAPTALRELPKKLQDQQFDLLLNLGDLIKETPDESTNIENFKLCLELVNQLPYPAIHLLGNHDLWGLPLETITQVFQELDLPPNFCGYQDLPHHQIVWLDLIAPMGKHGSLPLERIDWLNSIVDPHKPVIIFSHYGLLSQDSRGNYYFEKHPQATALTNGPQVWRLIRHLPIQAVISAHTHWAAYSQVDHTHMITIPSFTENIAGGNNHHPSVYSILELSPRQLLLKSFSDYCLFNLQLQL